MKITEITASSNNNEVTLEFLGTAIKGAGTAYRRGKALKAANSARKARQATNIFGMGKYSLKGLKGKELKAMIAKRAQVGNAAARGQAVVKSFNTKLLDIVSLLGIGYYFYDYWTQITVVEDDLEEFAAAIKAGTNVPEENMFRGFKSEEEARAEAIAIREELLGMTTINIVLAAGFAGALVKNFGKIVSMLPFLGVPGKFIQVLGSKIVAPLGRIGGAALLLWFETDSGKAFLKDWAGIILVIGKGVSSAMSFGIEQLDNLEAYLEKETGKDIPGVPDVVRSKIVPSAADNAAADAKDLANSVIIGRVRATDNNGFLRTDSDFFANPGVKNAVGLAIRKGQPNPLDAIPKKPGATYPTFTPSLDRFSW
jgi:hypothetical protein